jgi:hypothetical protein
VRARYSRYKNDRRRNTPGLPVPNPIPAASYGLLDVNHAKAHGTLPGQVAPGGLQPAGQNQASVGTQAPVAAGHI